jgi:hypothetical protein
MKAAVLVDGPAHDLLAHQDRRAHPGGHRSCNARKAATTPAPSRRPSRRTECSRSGSDLDDVAFDGRAPDCGERTILGAPRGPTADSRSARSCTTTAQSLAQCCCGRAAVARCQRRDCSIVTEQSSRPPWRRGCYRTRSAAHALAPSRTQPLAARAKPVSTGCLGLARSGGRPEPWAKRRDARLWRGAGHWVRRGAVTCFCLGARIAPGSAGERRVARRATHRRRDRPVRPRRGMASGRVLRDAASPGSLGNRW